MEPVLELAFVYIFWIEISSTTLLNSSCYVVSNTELRERCEGADVSCGPTPDLPAPTILLPPMDEPANREVLWLPCRLSLCCQKVFPYWTKLTNADGRCLWLMLTLLYVTVLLFKVEACKKFTSVLTAGRRPTYSALLTTCLGLCAGRAMWPFMFIHNVKCCMV